MTDAPSSSGYASDWPFGEGAIARAVRAVDWSATPLGPRDQWPEWLVVLVGYVLSSPLPMVLLLEPGAVMLGNDALAAVAGPFATPMNGEARRILPDIDGVSRALEGEQWTAPPRPLAPGQMARATHTPARDPSGEVRGLVTTFEVVASSRSTSRGASLPHRDERHRVRNMLSLMRTVARRSRDRAATLDSYLMRFDGRMDAIARAQAMLAAEPNGLDLWTLASEEFLEHGFREGENATLDGPDVVLSPKAAEVMSLALHELSSNAIEHGSVIDGGTLSLVWRPSANGGVVIDWRDGGAGEAQTAEPEPGFGFEVIRHMVPYELDAETEISMAEDGALLARITLPPNVVMSVGPPE